MEIYRFANPLVVLTENDEGGDASTRVSSNASHEWEKRMDQFQQPLASSSSCVKWKQARKIFDLSEHDTINHPTKDISL